MSALISVEQQRAIAEVQAAMLIARMNPRDVVRSEQLILKDCERPSFCEGALYAYGRGGSDVTGLSINAAQAMAQRYGNIQWGTRELEQRDGESVMQSYAWDLETGAKSDRVFIVAHVRKARGSFQELEDPRDIYELTANQGSRRTRACLLAVMPEELTSKARAKIEETLLKVAEPTPERVSKLLQFFRSRDISEGQVRDVVQRDLSALKPIHMVRLIKIANSLRDGMSTPADWFKGGSNARVVPMPQAKTETKPATSATTPASADQAPAAATATAAQPAASQPAQSNGSTSAPSSPAPAASAPAPASTPATSAGAEAWDPQRVYHPTKVWPDAKQQGYFIETEEGLRARTYHKTTLVPALEMAASAGLGVRFIGKADGFAYAPIVVEKIEQVEEREPGEEG
jgi:hypothetical protein